MTTGMWLRDMGGDSCLQGCVGFLSDSIEKGAVSAAPFSKDYSYAYGMVWLCIESVSRSIFEKCFLIYFRPDDIGIMDNLQFCKCYKNLVM